MKKVCTILFLLTLTLAVFGQQVQIQGVVVNGHDNQPLPGVNIMEKGTTNGTLTDVNGSFSLKAASNGVLTFTSIGFISQEIAINGKTTFNVILKEDSELLDEVVVIGYGVQKKSVVTAAISRVTADDLEQTRPSRIEDVLKGKVAGVQITQSSGQPGSDSKVRIRGIGTVNDSDPLYIVDGMPVGGGFNYLNPADIQSVEVLKDAASAAIYGTRGANGVILITTKSGQAGKPTISYNFSYGWQNPWKKRGVLDAKEYMVIMNEALINDGNAPRYLQDEVLNAGKGTDWQKETFNSDAPVQNHQLSVSGGSDKLQYYLSLGYYAQDGIVGGNFGKSNYDRWSIRSNTTYEVFEAKDRNFLNKVKVGANLAYSRNKSTSVEANSEYGSILGSALAFNPLIPVYANEETAAQILQDHPYAVTDENGNVFSIPPTGFQELANPVAMLRQPRSDKNNDDKFVGSFWAELNVLPGLKFKSSYSFDLAFWGNDGYQFPYFLATMGKDVTQSSVWSSMNRGQTWLVENILTYSNTFAEKHNLTAVIGQSAQRYRTRNVGGDDYDLLENDPGKANINSAIADRDEERVWGGTGGFNHESLASYFGRIDYNYDERYMLQATIRRDGSSKFGANNKWATFPAVSLGWNILNEPYLGDIPHWFDMLKLRFSWGKNGNQNIGNFRYTSLMDGGQTIISAADTQ